MNALLTPTIARFSAEQNAQRPCLGTRSKATNGDVGEYTWLTYEQVFEKVKHFASGLVNLGLEPVRFDLTLFCFWITSFLT